MLKNNNYVFVTVAGRKTREDPRVVGVPASPDAAGGGATEAAGGGVRARAARRARAAAAAHPAARDGLRHRHAQPHQRHTLRADQVRVNFQP